MKKNNLLLILLIAFATVLQSQNNKGLEDGLVAYYPFNGNANDESGNGNNGTVNGATLTTDRFGNINSAFEFDGNDFINCGNSVSFNWQNSDFTVSAWIKRSSQGIQYPSYQVFIGKQEQEGNYRGFYFRFATDNLIEFSMVYDAYPWIGNGYVNSTNEIVDTLWNHYCAVYEGSSGLVKLYINGTINNFTTDPDNYNIDNSADLFIGRKLNGEYFYGIEDDIRIYNRALTEEEIQTLYNTTPFDLTVFLEGSYNGTEMNTILNPEQLPLTQPYNDPQKWNYQGTESVASIPNEDIVDWVLVELRETSGDASTAIADSMIARKAAFLLKDGSIVDLDGENPLYFDNAISDYLYVVVYHRNHLPVMSSAPLTKINNGYSWDFTTSAGQAYGTDALKNLGSIYGMIGGDSDANGIINMDDKDLDWSSDVGRTGYFPSDLNMDSEVNNPDKNDIWEPNLGSKSKLPELWTCGDQLIDDRDGQNYNTVLIGTQCWMAENLNIGTMINGSSNQTDNSTIEKYCYDNNTSNCDIYGGLYQWNEMMQYSTTEGIQGICPTGWHFPTDAEWCILENYVDDGYVNCGMEGWRGTNGGGNLKETGTELWNPPNTGATNSSGFSALPVGDRSSTGIFNPIGLYGSFWSSNEISNLNAWGRHVKWNGSTIARGNNEKARGFSMRCIIN